MKPDTWHTLALVFFCLAAVLALVALALFFLLKIPSVRNTLTGKTAEREIAQLRHTRHELWRAQESTSGLSDNSHNKQENQDGAIEVRMVSPALGESQTVIADESETVLSAPDKGIERTAEKDKESRG